jgi:hypothetical protein
MNRAFRLACIALAAEGLRLRLLLRARLRQGALVAAGLIFCLFALALAHVAAFLSLTGVTGAIGAALALAGVDLLIALGLLLAARAKPALPAEARAVREAALAELRAMWPEVALALMRFRRERPRR